MKILLINPPLREQYPPQSFPYGLGYVSKFLKKAGHQVEILDIDTERYSREDVVSKIKDIKCDLIGTGGIITVYKYLKWLVPELRKFHPQTKIIVGGSLPTSTPEVTLNGLDIDFIVIGEGEISTINLVNFLEAHKHPKVEQLKKIRGIGFKDKGELIINEPEELIKGLTDIGFPDWKGFNIEKILVNLGGYMSIITERGCPFNCNFCYHQFGYKPRRIPLPLVVKEMRSLNKKYGIKHFSICDNLFVFDKNEIVKFIELQRKYKLNVTYDTSMRASLVTPELIRLLKKSGCTELSFGFESGSQKVLDLMNKRTSVQQMDNAIRICEAEKMGYFGTFIIGYPGETKEDIDKTIEFCIRHNLLAKPFFATPYPGTQLFEQIKHKIKDMDKFVESLGDARDLVINISEFSDKELIKQRRRVTEETEKAYLKKHRILGLIFSPLRLLNIEVGFVVKMFLEEPFLTFIKNAFKTGFGYLKGNKVVPTSDEGYNKTLD